MKQIKFSHPRRGLEGVFATFRLGLKPSRDYAPGDLVELVCARSGKLLKRATVLSLHTGELTRMAALFARDAHNWREHPFLERPQLLIASMKKRYPPGRARDDSQVTVIYLREQIHEQSDSGAIEAG